MQCPPTASTASTVGRLSAHRLVANNSGAGGGGVVAYITSDVLGGIHSRISVRNFNRWVATDLRARVDVLHFTWGGSPSIEALWPGKLEDFVAQGGSILWEEANANLAELVDGIGDLTVDVVEYHVEGDDPAVVSFETGSTEDVLNSFEDGVFAEGPSEAFCLNPMNNPFPETITTLGLGFGCFVNNHFTFLDPPMDSPWVPFLRLVGGPDGADAVGVYGDFSPGRIVLIGVDHGFHAHGPGPFQANHFCALMNEIIWLSHLPVTAESDARAAMDNCVTHAQAWRTQSEE